MGGFGGHARPMSWAAALASALLMAACGGGRRFQWWERRRRQQRWHGRGGYGAWQTLPGGRLPGSVAVADLDGDGRADILVARPDGPLSTIGVLLQQPGGGFDAERAFEISSQTGIARYPISLVDVNGDALPDLLVGPDLLLRRPTGPVWPAAAPPGARQRLSIGSLVGHARLGLSLRVPMPR